MREVKNIVWDWNGTLLNDIALCIDCMNILLEERSLPRLSPEYYKEVFAFPVKDYFLNIGFDFSKEDFELPANKFVVLYNKRYPEAGLYSDVRQILGQFREQGVRQYILSAQEQQLLNRLLKHFDIRHFFDAVTGTTDNYAHSKLEAGQLMMDRLGLGRDETIMIGDTDHDHAVASSLGIPCLLISRGHQSAKRLLSTGAPVLKNLLEIPRYLGNHNNP
ncbi:MAG: HAD family hydrolase [Bacteroidales bacterium]